MLQLIRKVNKDTAAAINQIITLPNHQLMELQKELWHLTAWFHPKERNAMIHTRSWQNESFHTHHRHRVAQKFNDLCPILMILVVGSHVGEGHAICPHFVQVDLVSAVILCWCPQEFVTLSFSNGICSDFEPCCKKHLKGKRFAHFSHVTFVNTDISGFVLALVHFHGCHQYDSYALRRAPQQNTIHMAQQMTTRYLQHMMVEPVSLLLRMHSMAGVTLQNWNQRDVDLL